MEVFWGGQNRTMSGWAEGRTMSGWAEEWEDSGELPLLGLRPPLEWFKYTHGGGCNPIPGKGISLPFPESMAKIPILALDTLSLPSCSSASQDYTVTENRNYNLSSKKMRICPLLTNNLSF